MSIKALVRKVTPFVIYDTLGKWKSQYQELRLIKNVAPLHEKAIKKLKSKEIIRCVFFATYDSSWQYDKVYQLMDKHPRFSPVILICPVVNNGYDNMLRRMKECEDYFSKMGYKFVKAYDEVSDKFIDVREDLSPDLIFYTSPYKGLVDDDRFFITNFLDIPGIYVPYFINGNPGPKFSTDGLAHNLVWRKYAEYQSERDTAVKYQRVHGRNVVVTGYPEIEEFIKKDFVPSMDDWKSKDPRLKRIIWAPHHTLTRTPNGHSCFLPMSDFMLDMAQKYQDKIQIVFKPHPILYNNLEKLWGKAKTDDYYSKWKNRPNTSYQEGKYIDLFYSSDAMIHDSGSFVFEYLFMNKPVLRTIYDIPLEEMFNELALSCLDQHYKAYNVEDVEAFIMNVIDGVDPLKTQRVKFVNEVLMPKGNPSQNIIDDILDSIDNQIVYRS